MQLRTLAPSLLAAVSLALGACAPAATPSPTTAPAKPAEASKAAESKPAESKPAAAPSGEPIRIGALCDLTGATSDVGAPYCQGEKDYVESLELAPDYIAAFETLSGVELRALAESCAAFLRDTQAMWDEVHPEFVRRGLGIEPREATRADALALLRAREFDRYFPAEQMEPAVRRQHREIGIDPEAAGRIRLDIGEREGKRSRAISAPV